MRGGFKPALRVGMAASFRPSGLDLGWHWLRFHTHGEKSRTIDPTSRHFLLATEAIQGGQFAGARLKNAFKFDVVTLELGRAFAPLTYLSFRPHMGLVSAWIQQHFRNFYTGEEALTVLSMNRFTGVGLRGGLDLRLPVAREWNLFAEGAGSLLRGWFALTQKEDPSSPFQIPIHLSSHEGAIVPALEMRMGIRWDRLMADDHCRLGLRLGYEFQRWFNQNRFFDFANQLSFFADQSVRRPGDVAFQGVLLGGDLSF